MMKRKAAQRETQRAYVHALSDSGSHIREKERRPGRTPKRFETAEISMRSDLPPFRKSREAQFLFFSGTKGGNFQRDGRLERNANHGHKQQAGHQVTRTTDTSNKPATRKVLMNTA